MATHHSRVLSLDSFLYISFLVFGFQMFGQRPAMCGSGRKAALIQEREEKSRSRGEDRGSGPLGRSDRQQYMTKHNLYRLTLPLSEANDNSQISHEQLTTTLTVLW
ncbi:hypothetical protein F4777DRAFT_204620 [Nemania sp. FL0916]|nr:hypothetical protein F4777DRAFT_204620 [Nemania sp. FL0916]